MLLLFLIWVAALGVYESVSAFSITRGLTLLFQRGSRNVFVSVADSPLGPQGMVSSGDLAGKEDTSSLKNTERLFTMPRPEFDKMWSTITSPNLQKYAVDQKSHGKFDMTNSYVFVVTRDVGKLGVTYVIPKNQASQTVAAIAAQLRGYAK